jgi:hypothetical protein
MQLKRSVQFPVFAQSRRNNSARRLLVVELIQHLKSMPHWQRRFQQDHSAMLAHGDCPCREFEGFVALAYTGNFHLDAYHGARRPASFNAPAMHYRHASFLQLSFGFVPSTARRRAGPGVDTTGTNRFKSP